MHHARVQTLGNYRAKKSHICFIKSYFSLKWMFCTKHSNSRVYKYLNDVSPNIMNKVRKLQLEKLTDIWISKFISKLDFKISNLESLHKKLVNFGKMFSKKLETQLHSLSSKS